MKKSFGKRFLSPAHIIVSAVFISCSATHNAKTNTSVFDRQAHRGGRGLMPENTIASEENAIDYDCTLEMDLQMSKDKQIVVSHDAYFNSAFCLTPEGNTMTKKDGASRLIYRMNYDSVMKYETGLKPHPDFPRQKKIHTYKPLLSVLIDSVEAYAKKKHHVNHYNIEIKSNPKYDGKNYSNLQEYVSLAMQIIITKKIAERTVIQSFDTRALELIHKEYPHIKTSFLVNANNKKNAAGYLKELSFKPDIFSPEYNIVDKNMVNDFHAKNILVIPWTPDTQEDIQHLIDLGADGAITDYPDLYTKLKFR